MTSLTPPIEQQRRKKVRKGTKSCLECKRRKIRCNFREHESICVGCLDRGTACVSQELDGFETPAVANPLSLRMTRVEQLLEQLISRVDEAVPSAREREALRDSKDDTGLDVISPICSARTQYEHAPILSLFNNNVIGHRQVTHDNEVYDSIESTPAAVPTPASSHTYPAPMPTARKWEALCRFMQTLMPSQADVDQLSAASTGWWMIQRCILPHLFRKDASTPSTFFSVDFPPGTHPNLMARLLLALSICIQQLPPTFDTNRLQMKEPPKDAMDRYMSFVINHVTSDDEVVGNMEGLECLILQGVHQINGGHLRRSWLTYRRALNLAQLMGLHRFQYWTKMSSDVEEQKRIQSLWYQILKSERYVALILGVPSGTNVEQIYLLPSTENTLSKSDLYTAKLCHIAGLVLNRNEADISSSFTATQDIDLRLEKLAREMSPEWWALPDSAVDKRHLLTPEDCDKISPQLWHFQLEAFLHLPFMLRAPTDRRYEYSKISCLRASREMIKRWLFLRQVNYSAFVCKVIDFQAFTACVTLLLTLLMPIDRQLTAEETQLEVQDRVLIQQVIDTLESFSGDTVAVQSVEALKTLLAGDREKRCEGSTVQLTIPHFGTIVVTSAEQIAAKSVRSVDPASTSSMLFGPNVGQQNDRDWNHRAWGGGHNNGFAQFGGQNHQQQQQLQHGGPNSGWDETQQQPVVSFTSSQFPPFGTGFGAEMAAGWDDVNAMLFDTLMSSDVDGEWHV